MEYLGMSYLAAGLGAGLVVIGASLGIGRLASGALEGMARQPELSGDLRTAMIIAAALIEGFTFFALVVTFMLATQAPKVPEGVQQAPAGGEPVAEEQHSE